MKKTKMPLEKLLNRLLKRMERLEKVVEHHEAVMNFRFCDPWKDSKQKKHEHEEDRDAS